MADEVWSQSEISFRLSRLQKRLRPELRLVASAADARPRPRRRASWRRESWHQSTAHRRLAPLRRRRARLPGRSVLTPKIGRRGFAIGDCGEGLLHGPRPRRSRPSTEPDHVAGIVRPPAWSRPDGARTPGRHHGGERYALAGALPGLACSRISVRYSMLRLQFCSFICRHAPRLEPGAAGARRWAARSSRLARLCTGAELVDRRQDSGRPNDWARRSHKQTGIEPDQAAAGFWGSSVHSRPEPAPASRVEPVAVKMTRRLAQTRRDQSRLKVGKAVADCGCRPTSHRPQPSPCRARVRRPWRAGSA